MKSELDQLKTERNGSIMAGLSAAIVGLITAKDVNYALLLIGVGVLAIGYAFHIQRKIVKLGE
jgi:hypothetical protein